MIRRRPSGEDNAVLEIGVEWEALGDPGGGVRGLPDLSAVLVVGLGVSAEGLGVGELGSRRQEARVLPS